LSDSLVKTNTNLDFFNELIRDSIIHEFEYVSGDSAIDLEKFNNKKYYNSIKQTDFWIEYRIKPQFTYCVINEKGTLGQAMFTISMDKNYNIKDFPNFQLYMNSLKRFVQSNVIDKMTAISIAKEHESKNTRDSHMAMLIFDARDNSLYWRITRHKGFRNVTEEHILINANNAKFIRLETDKYFRNFWMTIGDILEGIY